MTNILLVTIDSLRADHVGVYGYERNTTPNIDDVASEGKLFEQAFAHACSTRPSFPTILTSSYPLMYGGYERLSENRTLISELLQENGYSTAGFHSNAYLNPEFGYGRGFDHFYDSMADPNLLARLRLWVKNRLDKDGVLYRLLASAFFTAERQTGANLGSAYVDANEITDQALGWVASNESDNQFIWVHYMDVHHPYLPPEEHQLEFRDQVISERDAIKLRRKFLENPDAITESEFLDIIDLYDAEIRYTDTEIGRLISGIEREWGDLITIITADHGEEFKDHGRFSHHATYYDEVIHVPFIVSDSDSPSRSSDPVGLIDVAPTILDYTDISPPDNYFGASVNDKISKTGYEKYVVGDWSSDGKGEVNRRFFARGNEWKYIRHTNHAELYHLTEDPGENTNVIDQYPEIRDTLAEIVDTHENQVEVTWEDLGNVDMDEEVRARLRDLGYQE